MFFVDLLDSLPRLRLSDSQLRMILWIMSQCGALNVPSLYKLRQWQKRLQKQCGTETRQHCSSLGNIFYSNNICGTIAMDFAKPAVAPRMRPYPEVSSKGIREVRQAGRFGETPLEQLTPMYSRGSEHFFVNELAQLETGQFFVPILWHYRDGELCASGYPCEMKVVDAMALVLASKFRKSMPTLIVEGLMPGFHELSEDIRRKMPNPLRELAGGAELYSVFLYIWADDVSGNVSKQYNKHNNLYVANMNLPPELLQQEFFVHFFSTSPHASTAEQFSAIKEQINSTHVQPFPAYNAASHTPCKFRLFPLAFPADNPQQSDECSHMTGQATRNCRKCMNRRRPPADGSDPEGVWYMRNYARGAETTLNSVKQQFKVACDGFATNIKEEQTESGVKDRIAEYWIQQLLDRAKELKAGDRSRSKESIADELLKWLYDQPGDKWNVLLDWIGVYCNSPRILWSHAIAGVDPHRDTPVELLHTILLGIVKYMWHSLHMPWAKSPQNAHLFTIRLQETDTLGLSIPPLRAAYMYQYRNGLIGKHFKSLAQTIVFHVHDLTSEAQFGLIKATGELCALLWYPVIKNMDSYLEDLDILIKNVLAAYAQIDPLRILEKVKIHLLVHLVHDIRRFGPAIRFSTEIFECFNAIFRMCSVLSNHLAPSRDIALSIARMDRLKHIVSGGFWHDGTDWVQAGPGVQSVLQEHAIVQRHLGWTPEATFKAVQLFQRGTYFSSSEQARMRDVAWFPGATVTSQLGDTCPVQSWVAFGDYDVSQSHSCTLFSWLTASQGQPRIGRVTEILIPTVSDGAPSLIALSTYAIGSHLHPVLDMPVLQKDSTTLIRAEGILFIINVQHDCITCKCAASGTRRVLQERQDSETQVAAWQHTSAERYVVNTHALHNAAELRALLPRGLTKPRHIWRNFEQDLSQVAGTAIQAHLRKEAERKAKAAETRRRNKEKAAAPASAGVPASDHIPEGEEHVPPRDEGADELGVANDDAQATDDASMDVDDADFVPYSDTNTNKRRRV
ncbi:hypothetical protein AURDEDRAFT_67175 [Auricularia subglabra TFB-10046 SS5]|nr:hypothetical protein AURDEDRAFT_67175 [Auricularia subglabra TFB-10046 SS5]